MDLSINDLVLVCDVASAVAPLQNEAVLVVMFIREIAWWISGLSNNVFADVAVPVFSGVVVGGTVCGIEGAR